jgi:hypothetical protein
MELKQLFFMIHLRTQKIMGWIFAVFDAKIGSEFNIPR